MHNKNNGAISQLLTGLILSFCAGISAVHADDPLNLTKQADIAFGTIDFEGTTGLGNITLGSNGNVTYGSNTSGNGMGTPAQLQITGTVGTTVSISCSNTGSLRLPGGASMQLSPVRFSIGASSTGSYATDTECSGNGIGVTTHTISANASENTIFIGGALNINGQPLTNGTYSTANGGSLPDFQILVQ